MRYTTASTALTLVVACVALPASAWTPPVSITNLQPQRELAPRVAHDAYGNLYVAWFGAGSVDDGAHWRIWLQSYNGVAWSAPLVSPLSDDGAANPDIKCDTNNDLHLVFDRGQEIYYRRRTAGLWSAPVNLANNANKSIIPKLAVNPAGTDVLVVWHEGGRNNNTYDIMARRFRNGAWEPLINMSNDSGLSSEPRVAIDRSGNYHVIWQDGDAKRVYYRQLSVEGAWGARYTLDTSSARSGTGYVAVSPGNVVHVLFSDDTTRGTYADFEVYHTFFDGSSWSSPVNISNNPGTSAPDDIHPAMAFDAAGDIHAVWHDYDNIWYAKRSGTTWGLKSRAASGPPGYTGSVGSGPIIDINVDGSKHVFWQARPNTWEVYYTSEGGTPPGPRGTLGGFVRDQLSLGVAGATVAAGAEIAVTATDGGYTLQLPPGTYSATASKQYYSPQTLSNISITADSTTTRDFVITTEAPAAPTLFSITAGNAQSVLAWKNSSSANFTGTRIRYQVDFPPAGPEDGTLLLDRAGSPNAVEAFTHTALTNGTTLYYSAFSYYQAATRFYSSAAEASGTPAGPGDFDRDGDVDQEDFGVFQACLGGPGMAPAPGCQAADLQGDLDVDQTDFELFTSCYSGPGFAANPNCVP